jgi:hypothetical protein
MVNSESDYNKNSFEKTENKDIIKTMNKKRIKNKCPFTSNGVVIWKM